MANLTDDKSTGEILKQDSEDCNAMAVRFVNIYIYDLEQQIMSLIVVLLRY